MLLNKKACKITTLQLLKEYRPALAEKLTRVSSRFLEGLELSIMQEIIRQIQKHPTIGKTITWND